MYTLTRTELEEYLREDLPYFDLTTHLQGVTGQNAQLTIFTREEIVMACAEEVRAIADMHGCETAYLLPSGHRAVEGAELLTLRGDYNTIHRLWRSVQILLEYTTRMATAASEMKRAIAEVNDRCELLTTRKSFPFAKRLCIKAVMTGGAMPHRLSLSETILLFEQHRIVYGSDEAFYGAIEEFRRKTPEKMIVVESSTLADATALMAHGADAIQIDKADPEVISGIVRERDTNYPRVKILAAGGINRANVREFAALGIDAVVTSSLYSAGMSNLGSRIELL